MKQTHIRNLIRSGWRPEDIHHVTGTWPPMATDLPQRMAPGLIAPWIAARPAGHCSASLPELVDAPLLASPPPASAPALRRAQRLLNHAMHTTFLAEAAVFLNRAAALAGSLGLRVHHIRALEAGGDFVAQRVLIAEDATATLGEVLRTIGTACGVVVACLHPRGVWSVAGIPPAVDATVAAYRNIAALQVPSWVPEQAWPSVLIGAASAGVPPPAPRTTVECAPLPEPLMQVLAADLGPPGAPVDPTWWALGRQWLRSQWLHSAARTPGKLVEIEA